MVPQRHWPEQLFESLWWATKRGSRTRPAAKKQRRDRWLGGLGSSQQLRRRRGNEVTFTRHIVAGVDDDEHGHRDHQRGHRPRTRQGRVALVDGQQTGPGVPSTSYTWRRFEPPADTGPSAWAFLNRSNLSPRLGTRQGGPKRTVSGRLLNSNEFCSTIERTGGTNDERHTGRPRGGVRHFKSTSPPWPGG